MILSDASLRVTGAKFDFPEYQISSEDFEVGPGEFLCLEAPSGFGKTTLLRGLLGLEKRFDAQIELGSKRIDSLPTHRRNFGVVFQDHLLFPNLDAWDNALFGSKMRRSLDDGARLHAEEGFSVLGLDSRKHAPITEMSGGERQRLALLRATLFTPDILILDEPLKGLDMASQLQVMQYLKVWMKQNARPVIWVSHQRTEELAGAFPCSRLIGKENMLEARKHRHFYWEK